MVGYNEATQEYAPAVNALRETLTSIQSDYSKKSDNVSFYKNNLLFDLSELSKKVAAENEPLTAEYNKQKTNDDVFAALNADIEKLTADMEASYGRVKDFKYHAYWTNEPPVSVAEHYHALMQNEIAQLTQNVTDDHKNVVLTDVNSYAGNIAYLTQRVVNEEIFLTQYEAKQEIQQEVNAPLDDALNVIQNSFYGGDRQGKLLDTYTSIKKMSGHAYDYNSDAQDGSIYHDIDGNYVAKEVEDEPDEPLAVDYLAEAWPALQERIAQMKASVEQLAKDADELSYVPGDADNNKKVSVNDYNEVRGWILSDLKFEDVSESQRYAGDVDEDKTFSVSDLNAIYNLMMTGTPKGEAAATAKGFGLQSQAIDSESVGMTKLSEETTVFGKTVRIALNVASNVAFTAGQFDVKLPAGMKLVGQEMTERANGHELLTNEIGDNLHRFVASTFGDNAFNGTSGALVVLEVQVAGNYAGGEIELGNVIFSDAQANSYKMAGQKMGGQATGINGITTASTAKERVFSIGGMLMKSVKKGINIIVGEDGKAHKVVKK